MNAYELADEINNFYKHQNQPYFLSGIQSTIRQIADRNALLEKECNRLSDHASELRKLHAQRIAELEKEKEYIKSEWISGLTRIAVLERSQELYTRPSKQLSDERIKEIILGLHGTPSEFNFEYEIEFAREIIKEMNK